MPFCIKAPAYLLWTCIGVDFGGARAHLPNNWVGKKASFCPPKIQKRIFENIEIPSESKTKNLKLPKISQWKQLFQLFIPYNLQNLQNFKPHYEKNQHFNILIFFPK